MLQGYVLLKRVHYTFFQDSNKIAHNSGVVTFNKNIKNFAEIDKLYNDCIMYTKKFFSTLVFPDQGILNLVLRLNKIPINKMNKTFNYTILNNIFFDKHIIHAVGGKSKFWNNGVTNILFPEWNNNNKTWIDLGGEGYTGPKYYWPISTYSQKELFKCIKYSNDNGYKINNNLLHGG